MFTKYKFTLKLFAALLLAILAATVFLLAAKTPSKSMITYERMNWELTVTLIFLPVFSFIFGFIQPRITHKDYGFLILNISLFAVPALLNPFINGLYDVTAAFIYIALTAVGYGLNRFIRMCVGAYRDYRSHYSSSRE